MAPQRPIGRRRKPQKIISFRALHQKNRFLVKALGQVAAETPGGADHGLRRGVPSPAAARHTTCPSHYGPKERPRVAAALRGEILGARCWSDGGRPIDNCVRPRRPAAQATDSIHTAYPDTFRTTGTFPHPQHIPRVMEGGLARPGDLGRALERASSGGSGGRTLELHREHVKSHGIQEGSRASWTEHLDPTHGARGLG